MAGHRVRLQQPETVGHVLALGAVRTERTLPGIAAVEQQHLVIAALRACRLHGRRQPVQPADTAVALGQCREIFRCQRISGSRFLRDAEPGQKILTGDMRRLPFRLAHAKIGRRLAEMHRHKLPMHVGDMQQRDVAERLKREQLGLCQSLLCQSAR